MRDSWVTKQILEFGEVISGGTPSTTVEEFWNGEVVWITPADLSKIKFPEIKTSRKKISLKGLNSSSANLISANSIVMSSRAPIGYFAVPSVDFSTNQGCKSIKLHNGQDSLFHYYNFLYNVEIFKRRGEGTTFAEISKKEVEKLSFTFPEALPQQQKIAKILSTVDTVIEKTETAIAKYQAIKQGLMHDLFTRGIDINTRQLRPTPEDAPELYKESALGLIPREWEDSIFKDYLIKNSYGPRFSGNDYDSDGNVKTIRGMDFSKDGEILYNQAPIALLPKSKVNSHLLETGDVVMVTTADCGLTAVFQQQDFQFIPSAYSVKFRFNEMVEPYFIKFFMQTDKAKRMVNKYVRQGTLGNLPGSDVLGFNIGLPTMDEQKDIIKRLKGIESKIQTEQQALAKYQQLKSGLMQDLLTGRVEVLVD
ncbi:restriction endonuclease subunit S [Bizionia argentinensis JUB59]|uniref:Restriction endonuclease subunit S n=1 Tax=Bizionia argentinensis JUB59 TaxID=1046627 RepID=G2ED23_9FLAO|nr:restriction endonuclease subunit S [Bizionia argentinensis]EGV43657.1 restriction endonuclease subunit S [Bizionia argentinensis JUB59]